MADDGGEVAQRLTGAEVSRLAELEAVIARGLHTFVEVGHALAEIRDSRLYRESFPTFEDYTRTVWDFRREVGDRYIRAANIVDAINPMGLEPPATERVARELVPLWQSEPDRLSDVWAAALERGNGRPTAADVRAILAPHAAPPAPRERTERERKHVEHAVAALARTAGGIVSSFGDQFERFGYDALNDVTLEDQWRRDMEQARVILTRVLRSTSPGE